MSRIVPLNAVILAAILLLTVGCECKYPGPATRYSVEVSLDDSLKDSRISVDLVAVNISETRKWENKSMTEYFSSGDPLRQYAAHKTFTFEPGKSKTQRFLPSDADWETFWKQWEGVTARNLFVMAYLPGGFKDEPGDQDARRRMLPLGKCAYDKNTVPDGVLKVKLLPSGIQVITAPRAPDAK